MSQVTKSGNGYYTDDAEYVVKGTTVTRGDGSFAVLASEQEAHAAAEALASGERSDNEFEWDYA